MNKQTGERELIGNCPKVLNYFNDTMFAVDCWDLIWVPKHREYSIKMYGCQDKWAVWMGDGLNDMLRANALCTYKACNRGNLQVRHCSQYKFLSKALDDGFKWVVE
eukprot:4299111-Ditylum_brightwellii.AAC.1